jgi:hypothetical protein
MTTKSHRIITNFVKEICENNYANADRLLESLITEKIKEKLKKTANKLKAKKCCGKKNCKDKK